jgi:F420-non-reducing hydrogenase small subunit
MVDKPKISMYWSAACGGCEISLANIHEALLDVDANFELAFSPCLVDGKKKDVEAMKDGEMLITFFNGAIRTSENEEMAHLLRKKSQILIAYGACAKEGGIPALSNLSSKESHFDNIYLDNPSVDNPYSVVPKPETKVEEGTLTIPKFYDRVKTLAQVVNVDYFMPGCPPEPEQLINVVTAVIKGVALPPKGSVIGAGNSTVCEECNREKSDKKITKLYRTYEIIPEPDKCLLEQGIVCMGIATRSGCGGLCPEVNMPCTGCYGTPQGVTDQGAKMVAALGSIIDIEDLKGVDEDKIPERINSILDAIPDFTGTFYKYSLADAIVKGRVQ